MKVILHAICAAAVLLDCTPAICLPQNIKHPNVAGQFYPSDADQLSQQIDEFLNQADVKIYDHHVPLVIVPHAGYIYSGQTAAYAFKAVSRQNPKTVIIIAPSHFFRMDGISIWSEGGFETPLGMISVDEPSARRLQETCSSCAFEPQVFEKEHSLEVEIPFVQKVFPRAKIIPVVIGRPSPEVLKQFAQSIGQLTAGRDDILVVVSSDWSHYHDQLTARAMDDKAIATVLKLDADRLWDDHQKGLVELCGFFPVIMAMILAKQQGWTQVDLLKTETSGHATGDYQRVVGYAALAFYTNKETQQIAQDDENKAQSASDLSLEDKRQLLDIAETTAQRFVNENTVYDIKPSTEALNRAQGVFVTLNKNGHLRGCIGRIITDQPLYKSTRDMAVAAASQDPRFPPVRPEEWKDIEVEVSVLSVPQDVSGADDIVLGRDGVIISQGMRQGIFLPQVADETGWTKDKFLSELCSQKAGLPSDCWRDPRTRIKVFTADVFTKNDLQ